MEKRIEDYPFLENTGEIGDLILNFNWEKTCIGSIDHWPVSLKITINNILHTAFPMFLFWGEDFLCFYNDAFRPSLGNEGKHPAIGKKAFVLWSEVWDFIGPLIQQVMITRKPVWFEDQLVPILRDGVMEDIYWTFSYSPAFGEGNQVLGVLCTCMETTKSVLKGTEK